MIVSKICGGLGNQLFQFAAGYSLAKRLGEIHLLDISDYKSYRLHNGFEIGNVFNIESEIASHDEVIRLLGNKVHPFLRKIHRKWRKISKYKIIDNDSYITEPYHHYWSGIETISGDKYLEGYWQSDKYFRAYEKDIKKQLTFRNELDEKNIKYRLLMKKTNSVGIHIRRGDYISSPATNKVMKVIELDYYKKAIAYINNNIYSPSFFIFSDDINWAKENFINVSNVEYIDHNKKENSYKDMHLLSCCKNYIIGNSTFSWWAAWLGRDSESIVIAPNKWFNDHLHNDRDLVPIDWTRL